MLYRDHPDMPLPLHVLSLTLVQHDRILQVAHFRMLHPLTLTICKERFFIFIFFRLGFVLMAQPRKPRSDFTVHLLDPFLPVLQAAAWCGCVVCSVRREQRCCAIVFAPGWAPRGIPPRVLVSEEMSGLGGLFACQQSVVAGDVQMFPSHA